MIRPRYFSGPVAQPRGPRATDAKRRPLSPQAAARYMRRRSSVRRRLVEEQRTTSMETGLYRLAGLMTSAREMGWSGAHDAEDDTVWKRWTAPRRAMPGEA